jgi:glycosyltransferase involved in cell wall biosynthesis
MERVILPVRNEAGSLGWVLERIPAGWMALVVDNGSTDGSAEVAKKHGAMVVVEDQPGYGSAVNAGLRAVRSGVVAVMDADGSLDPKWLTDLARPVKEGRADLVVGTRVARAEDSSGQSCAGAGCEVPAHSRIGNALFSRTLERRGGPVGLDPGPMRAFRAEAVLALGVVDQRFGWPFEMIFRAQSASWRIETRPVEYLPRRSGRSKVSGSMVGSCKAGLDMMCPIWRTRPTRG